ncbi:hypothetical protein WR25_06673 [Diploscapter pachys]|uniref:Uncharacterized protein n=1 Tax=Diploscapter pachys TaxID=2018661 RepID=A0A2A2KEL3_9BILA|nr:hypothetical protein WR25_06673 [Diploscapter pachys]
MIAGQVASAHRPAIASGQALQTFEASRQMIGRGRRHRRELLKQPRLASRPQGQCPQVLRLGPDTLCRVDHLAVHIQRRQHRSILYAALFGEVEGPLDGGMQRSTAQQPGSVEQVEPFELVARLEPDIHSPARLLQHQAMGRFDELRLQRFAQLQQRLANVVVLTYGQHLQEGLGQVHLRVLQRAAAQV